MYQTWVTLSTDAVQATDIRVEYTDVAVSVGGGSAPSCRVGSCRSHCCCSPSGCRQRRARRCPRGRAIRRPLRVCERRLWRLDPVAARAVHLDAVPPVRGVIARRIPRERDARCRARRDPKIGRRRRRCLVTRRRRRRRLLGRRCRDEDESEGPAESSARPSRKRSSSRARWRLAKRSRGSAAGSRRGRHRLRPRSTDSASTRRGCTRCSPRSRARSSRR
jgi:hypothetical protein